METFLTFISSTILILSFFLGMIALTRRPKSGMKNSFAFLCIAFFLINLDYLFKQCGLYDAKFVFTAFMHYILCLSIFLFSFYFPNYFRNMPVINQSIWFMIGFLTCSGLYEIVLLKEFSHRNWIVYLGVYLIAGLIIYLKTWRYFSNIRSFMRSSILAYSIVLAALIWNFLLPNQWIEKMSMVHFWNLLFLLVFLAFLVHFTFRANYVSIPLSTLFERTVKVLELTEPANKKGSLALKTQMLKYFGSSRLKDYVEEFHFNLLVDETLDNAIEHGGKRSYDDITIYIYESKKFTDIYVIDRGKGFNPKKIPNPLSEERKLVPSGRGIHILKGLFKVRWNFLGNEVCVRILNHHQKSKENI